MGNVISRCAQNLRNALRTCSKKHPEDEAMLSVCDSEPLDKCQEPLFDPSRAGVHGTGGSCSSLARLEDKIEVVDCKILPSTPRLSIKRLTSPWRSSHSCKGYQQVDHSESEGQSLVRSFIDQESQTNGVDCDQPGSACQEAVLSKEYIVKTYSIQNATPSPSTQAKFPPSSQSPLQEQGPVSSSSSPLVNLERRQEDVLKRLQQLQASVSKLAQEYKVKEAPAVCSVAQTTRTAPVKAEVQRPSKPQVTADKVLDLVINVNPDNIPFSLLILCEQLSKQYVILKSTFIHSSASESVPEKLKSLLTSNGGVKRGDSQIAINFVWKKVARPELVVDPSRQTPIQGEVNVARYLARLLNPAWDQADVIKATQVDELLDTAQLQILEGNSKEKAAAVRTLNSTLGKRDWLIGAEPSIADFCCWSALQQTGQVSGSPANVKKWLNLCSQHQLFETVSGLLS